LQAIRVVRKRDARNFLEGDEHCRLYVNTGKLLFGTSTLLPGKRGAVDTGHVQGDEVFYVARGRVQCFFPNKDRHTELEEGDIVVIPPGEPHQLVNASRVEAVICWALALPDEPPP
jgi:mannose-6-phosphate isomerase-like protein (cupin superfamily)